MKIKLIRRLVFMTYSRNRNILLLENHARTRIMILEDGVRKRDQGKEETRRRGKECVFQDSNTSIEFGAGGGKKRRTFSKI